MECFTLAAPLDAHVGPGAGSAGRACDGMSSGALPQDADPFDEKTEGTMANTRVPDIALINLGFLMALKEAVVRDPVQASYQFRLHPSDAAVIRDLGFDALESLALDLDRSIVTLRYTGQDLRDLLKTPRRCSTSLPACAELVRADVRSAESVLPGE
jgi:hypothetical protein